MEQFEPDSYIESSMTKITGLNNDCLEHVFRFLTLGDLLNVVDSNAHLNKAAGLVFTSKKYSNKLVAFSDDRFGSNIIFEKSNAIWIFGFRDSLRFLRCFGPFLLRVSLDFSFKRKSNYISQYVNEYCADFLLLEIIFKKGLVGWKNIQKSFQSVETVRITTYFSRNFSQLIDWFPKMRTLEISGYLCENAWTSISRHFPHLQNLITNNCTGGYKDNEKNFLHFLSLNSNLHRLHIRCDWNSPYLKRLIELLGSVDHLKIDCEDKRTSSFDGNIIYVKSVKKLELNFLGNLAFTVIPLQFDALDELVTDFYYYERGEIFSTFIKRHRSITKLTMRVTIENCFEKFCIVSLHNILRELPLLTEFELCECELSIQEVIYLVSKCPNLTKLLFTLDFWSKPDVLQTELGSKWNMTSKFLDRRYFVKLISTNLN